jgi:hypothetical protein
MSTLVCVTGMDAVHYVQGPVALCGLPVGQIKSGRARRSCPRCVDVLTLVESFVPSQGQQ